mgnify:CR=1 FL=1
MQLSSILFFRRETKVIKDRLVLMEQKVIKVIRVIKDRLVQTALMEQKVIKVIRVRRVLECISHLLNLQLTRSHLHPFLRLESNRMTSYSPLVEVCMQ